MNTIAIFGTSIANTHFKAIHSLLQTISDKGIAIYIYEPFHTHLSSHHTPFVFPTFKQIKTIKPNYIFSIGG